MDSLEMFMLALGMGSSLACGTYFVKSLRKESWESLHWFVLLVLNLYWVIDGFFDLLRELPKT